MSKNNNTLNQKEKQYRHLTKNDRIKIESLINQKDKNGKRLFNNTYIANYLGVHKSTISRELKNRKKDLKTTNRKLCLATFEAFKPLHDECIEELKMNSTIKRLSSFGI